jgi:cold-inducible RNA-binding protein
MSTRIYVGGLPFSTNDQDLFTLFRSYGEVGEATVATDRATGQSKGFGFVEMPDDAAARTAIAKLNGYLLDNRSIRVDMAQPRADRGADRPRREQRW